MVGAIIVVVMRSGLLETVRSCPCAGALPTDPPPWVAAFWAPRPNGPAGSGRLCKEAHRPAGGRQRLPSHALPTSPRARTLPWLRSSDAHHGL